MCSGFCSDRFWAFRASLCALSLSLLPSLIVSSAVRLPGRGEGTYERMSSISAISSSSSATVRARTSRDGEDSACVRGSGALAEEGLAGCDTFRLTSKPVSGLNAAFSTADESSLRRRGLEEGVESFLIFEGEADLRMALHAPLRSGSYPLMTYLFLDPGQARLEMGAKMRSLQGRLFIRSSVMKCWTQPGNSDKMKIVAAKPPVKKRSAGIPTSVSSYQSASIHHTHVCVVQSEESIQDTRRSMIKHR